MEKDKGCCLTLGLFVNHMPGIEVRSICQPYEFYYNRNASRNARFLWCGEVQVLLSCFMLVSYWAAIAATDRSQVTASSGVVDRFNNKWSVIACSYIVVGNYSAIAFSARLNIIRTTRYTCIAISLYKIVNIRNINIYVNIYLCSFEYLIVTVTKWCSFCVIRPNSSQMS